MKKILLIVLVTSICSHAMADTIKDMEGTKQLCEQSARAFSGGNPKQSIDILRAYWPLPDEEVDNLSYQTQSQLKMAAEQFGAPLGADFVGTSIAGDNFVRHTFLGKFENYAVRYVCVFYRPKDAWLVNNVYWDDQTELLFE